MNLKEIDFSKLKKYIPILLILIAIIISSHYRLYPSRLPITDEWSEKQHELYLKSQLIEQYPGITDIQMANLIKPYIKENQEEYNIKVESLSQAYKDWLKDENGNTYLLSIDPYYWYMQSKNIVELGHPWNKEEGKKIFTYRDGRFGKEYFFNLHPYIQAYFYKFLSFFSDISLMYASFILPVFIMAITIIPIFFIGKMISGNNFGGFFAALFLAINQPILARIRGGFSDTDIYIIIFPILAIWLYFLAINKKWYLSFLSGLLVSVYMILWAGAYYLFPLLGGCAFLYLIYSLIKKEKVKNQVYTLVAYCISSVVFISLFKGVTYIFGFISNVFDFIKMQDVGSSTIWPNVMTTVQELQRYPISELIHFSGGLLIVGLALIGAILLIFKERKNLKYSLFIIPWIIITVYSFTGGQRFAILSAPCIILLCAFLAGYLYDKSVELGRHIYLNNFFSKTICIIVCLAFLIPSFSMAKELSYYDLPLMNDSWYNILLKVKLDSPDGKAIITSWWDYGHIFYTFSERSVTFDGAKQGKLIHWVGKILITSDENESIKILKMLNCGQNMAYEEILKISGNNEYLAIQRLNELLNGREPDSYEKEIYDKYINCEDLWPQYFIVSEDMIGKAGTWSHYGIWDFDRAYQYQTVRSMGDSEALEFLEEQGYNNSDDILYQIRTTKADRWISSYHFYDESDEVINQSIFYKLMNEDGKGLNHFELIHSEEAFKIRLYKVKWT